MTSSLTITPLSSLKVSRHQIPAKDLTPNTSIHKKPLLIYHDVFKEVNASAVESHLRKIGVVEPQWRFTMYDTSHFHSTSHEVLAIVNGSAKLCFGGEDNDGRVEPKVHQGDMIIVPAGVSHRLLQDLDKGFQMVGSYPRGCNWDMCYGKKGEESKIEKIKELKWFDRDPVYGDSGPVLEV